MLASRTRRRPVTSRKAAQLRYVKRTADHVSTLSDIVDICTAGTRLHQHQGRFMYLHTLLRAMDILGSSERLRIFLKASKDHYQAWLSGSERVPEQAFFRAADIVVAFKLSRVQHVAPGGSGRSQPKSIRVHIGWCCARCPVCDSSDFDPVDPAAAEHNIRTTFTCSFCRLTLTRGDLVVLAGKEAASESAARSESLGERAEEGRRPHAEPRKLAAAPAAHAGRHLNPATIA